MGLKLNKNLIKAVIFDLDDTLFDTFGQLVTPANREACQAMKDAGLNAALDTCILKKMEFSKDASRQDVYKKLVAFFGLRSGVKSETVTAAGFDAFHNRKVIEDITPFDDCHSTLATLKKKYRLFLVTLGNPPTQKKKVEKLKLEPFFEKVIYVDVKDSHDKTGAFREIQKLTGFEPQNCVVVGNRIDLEIANGKSLNMQTILMNHGEYTHLIPRSDFERSDATITSLNTLTELL